VLIPNETPISIYTLRFSNVEIVMKLMDVSRRVKYQQNFSDSDGTNPFAMPTLQLVLDPSGNGAAIVL